MKLLPLAPKHVFTTNKFYLNVARSVSAVALALGASGCSGLLNSGDKASKVTTPSISSKKLTVSGPNSGTIGQCVPAIIGLQNDAGQSTVADVAFNVSILGANVGELYSDSNCLTVLTPPLAWPLGASAQVAYLKGSASQIYTLQFIDLSGKANGAFQVVNVTAAANTGTTGQRLAMTGPVSFRTGQCKVFVISLQDANGAATTRSTPTSVNLGGVGSGNFKAGSACAGGVVSSVSIPANSAITTFSFLDLTPEILVFTADAGLPAIASTYLSVEVQSNAAYLPSQLTMSGPSSVTSGACSGPVQVKTLDSFGTIAVNAADQPFTLVGNLGFQAYADASCVTPLISPKILANNSAVNFYFKASSSGTLNINADDGGPLLDGALSVAVTGTVVGNATKLAMNGPNSLVVGNCSSAFTVRTQDGSNTDYAVTSTTTVALTGKSVGQFYSDASCTSITNSLVFSVGDTNKSFYYKSGAVGGLVFSASDAGGVLTPASVSLSVVAGGATKLTVTGPSPINVGDCRPYVVTSQDPNGFDAALGTTTPINLTGAGAGAFYSDAGCASNVTSVNINSGQTNAIFYYRATVDGARSIAATPVSGTLTAGTLAVTVSPLPAAKVVMSRPVLMAGSCTAMSIGLKDSTGGASIASSPVSVTLSTTGGAGFFSANTCTGGTAITTASVAATQSSVTVYVLDNLAEAVTLVASSGGLTADSWSTTVSSGVPTKLTLQGAAALGVGACSAYTVNIKDAQNNLSPLSSSSLITFAGAGAGHFSTAGDCSTTSSTITISAGSNQGVIYYVDNSAQAVTLTASASGLTGASVPVTISAGGAVKSVWTLSATSTTAGTCLTGSLQIQDSLNNPVNQVGARTLNLSGLASGVIYTSGDCTSGATTTLTVPNAANSVSFSFKDNVAEALTVAVGSTGLTTSNQSITILSAAPSRWTLAGPAAAVASDCTGYDLRAEDSLGNLSGVTAPVTVNFSGLASGRLYSDAGCSSQISSASFTAGTSLKTVYLKDTAAENLSVVASGGALTSATKSVSISAQGAVRLALSGSNSMSAGTCATFTVQVQDALGNGVAQATPLTVNLAGNGNGSYYSDASCTSVITTTSIAASTSSQTLRFKSIVAESLTLTAQAIGLADGTKAFNVNAGSASKMILSGLSSIGAGVCSGYTLSIQDSLANPSSVGSAKTVNFSGTGTGSIYTDASCTNAITSVGLTSTQTSLTLYYKANSAQSVTLAATDVGLPDLTDASLAVSVTAGAATKLVWNLSAVTVTSGTCVTGSLQVQDVLNNPISQASPRAIGLTGLGSAQFYTSGDCTSGATSSLTIATSQSAITFSIKDNGTEALTISASSAGLPVANQAFTVNAGTPVNLKFAGPATVNAGECNAYDLRVEDSLGNRSATSSITTINFSGLGAGKFYSDSACASLVASTSIASGASLVTIYFRDTAAEALTVSASGGSFTSATKAVTVQPLAASKLVMSGATSAAVGSCTTFGLQVQDSLGNAINQASALTVNLGGSGNGAFYSDAACTTLASTVSIGIGTSSQVVRFKSNVPESLSFLAQATGLIDANKTFSVNPQPPSKLVLTGAGAINNNICASYTVAIQDPLNNLSPVGSAKTLNFTGAGTGGFFSDSACSVSATSLVFTSFQTTGTIYFKSPGAQSVTLNVDDSGLPDLTAANLPVVVTASGGGTTLVLKYSGSSSINTNTCVPYALTTVDGSGNSVNVTSNLAVTLAGAGTGNFYSDSACGSITTTSTVVTGSSLQYIYYKNTAAQNLVFSATASGASSGTFPVTVINSAAAGAPAKLALAGNAAVTINTCVPYIVSLTDSNNNSVNAASTTAITLSGAGAGDFYSDSGCTISAAGATSIASGASYKTFYFKDPTSQSLILVGQSTGLANGTFPITVNPPGSGSTSGPAVKLTFISQPSSTATVNVALASQPIVSIQDSSGNVVTAASNSLQLTAYSDAACTTVAGGVLSATTNPLPASGGVANFAGVAESSAQTVYLGASSSGLASACSTSIQVYPSVPAKLAFTTQPSNSATAGALLGTQPQVSVQNFSGQVMTSSTNSVSISAFTDSGCSTAATGNLTLTANNLLPSSGVVSFGGISYDGATTIYLKATSSGLTSTCSTGIVVSPAAAYKLSYYTPPPSSVTAAVTFSTQVSLRDQYNNIAPVSDSISLAAYSTANCTGGLLSGFSGGTSTAASLGTATFNSVAETVSGTMSILATDVTNGSVLTVCSGPIAVGGGTPTALSFSIQPSPSGYAYSNLLTSPSVRVTDTYGNLVQNASNSITLAAYTDASCTSAATGTLGAAQNPLSPNAGVAVFTNTYYNKTGTIYIRASSSGLTSACSTAVVIGGSSGQIAVGDNHTCAISNSYVYCWGLNTYGQLGNGTTANAVNTAVQVLGPNGSGVLSGIVYLAASLYSTCGLTGSGTVYCWGYNAYGELGDATLVNKSYPVQVKGIGGTGTFSGVTAISGGYLNFCGIVSGTAACWGYNSNGQLGNNTATDSSFPVQVKGVGGTGTLSSVTSIAVGQQFSCAVSASNAYCWGYNGSYQLGDNTATQRYAPAVVVNTNGSGVLPAVSSVTAGSGHACATSTTGSAFCWGLNSSGQLGETSSTNRSFPFQVTGVGGIGFLTGVQALAASTNHTCALTTAGAYCWGANSSGNLGDNTTTPRYSPVQTLGVGGSGTLANIWQISSNSNASHTCGVSTTGGVYCWGKNLYGQLGNAQANVSSQTTPVQAWNPGSVSFSQMATGSFHSCGLSGGNVYCWGYNPYGGLGNGNTTQYSTPQLVVSTSGSGALSGITSISVGDYYSCAINGGGTAYCWGYNTNGQLGTGNTTNRSIPTQVSSITGVTSLSAGPSTACASLSTGSAYCWGNGANGQIGNNSTANQSSPTQVVSTTGSGALTGVTALANSGVTTCAIASGAAYCWGYNAQYQLGNGGTTTSYFPVAVSGMSSGVTAIAAAYYGSCGIQNGSMKCWGYTAGTNSYYGTTPNQYVASGATGVAMGYASACTIVSNQLYCYVPYGGIYPTGYYLNNVQTIGSMGGNNSSDTACFTVSGGSAYCMGNNNNNQLGNASSANQSQPFQITSPIPTGLSITSIAAGTGHSCAVANGGVNCWGNGTAGDLGNGSTAQVVNTSQVIASGGTGALISIASVTNGGTHSCALSSGGAVFCWGDNLFGDLGNNQTTQSTSAVQVSGPGGISNISNVSHLSSGYHHNCAVISGSVYCWGWDSNGQLGNNSTISAAAPVQVVGVGGTGNLTGITATASGYSHTCGLTTSGTVYCWGNNTYGQLGNNSNAQSNTPVQVVSVSGSGTLNNVTTLVAGAYHTCAVSGGQVFCWGSNGSGQLGTGGTGGSSSYPAGTLNSGFVGLTGITSLTAGLGHTCAVSTSGGGYCWGDGSYGQLGTNSTSSQNVAVPIVDTSGTGTLSNVSKLASGAFGNHTCALNIAGTAVNCWGAGGSGQLGNNTTVSQQLYPTPSIVANIGITYFLAR